MLQDGYIMQTYNHPLRREGGGESLLNCGFYIDEVFLSLLWVLFNAWLVYDGIYYVHIFCPFPEIVNT